MKEFSGLQRAKLKKTAQTIEVFLKAQQKIKDRIARLEEQLDDIQKDIEIVDSSTVAITGYHTRDLFKKIAIPTDKTDKEGNLITKTNLVFKYPKTIIPVELPLDTKENIDN